MSVPALLFDLDGTLTDPRPGIVACLRHAMEGLGRACPDDEVLAALIGPPLRGTFARLLATTDGDRIEAAMGLYRERYGETGLYENRVYDGIREMLAEVAARAPAVFVATSKPTVYAERIVRHFTLDRHFTRVYGSATARPTSWPPGPTACGRSACCGVTAPSRSCARPAPKCCAPSRARSRGA